jgi:general stress protein 26
MTRVSRADEGEFFRAVDAASRKAVWCALATSEGGRARVRMIHPTWEGDRLWFATGTSSPKLAQLRSDPRVEIQYQVAPPDFVHVIASGSAEIVGDPAEKKRVWDLIDYDLGEFWPGGPTDPEYTLVRVRPERVELSRLFGSQDKRVWTRAGR